MNLSLLAIAVQAAQRGGARKRKGHYAVISAYSQTPLAVFVLKNGVAAVFHPYDRQWYDAIRCPLSNYNVLAEFNKPDE